MDAAALAAIGGPVVGLAGVYYGWRSGRDQREHAERLARTQQAHEQKLARDARLNTELRAAYEELLRLVFLVEDVVNRTNPMIGPAPAPPPTPSDDEVRQIMARVSAIGSETVFEKLEAVWTAQREFVANSSTLDAMRNHDADPGDLWQQVQAAREKFRDRARELERLIRAEVRA